MGVWDLHFVLTPFLNYVNEDMIESEGYSLTIRLGFIDFLNKGKNNTEPFKSHRQKILSPHDDTVPCWFFDGFVFAPDEWRLFYRENPLDFYTKISSDSLFHLILLDVARKSVVRFTRQQIDEEDEDDGSENHKDADKANSDAGGGGSNNGSASSRSEYREGGGGQYAQRVEHISWKPANGGNDANARSEARPKQTADRSVSSYSSVKWGRIGGSGLAAANDSPSNRKRKGESSYERSQLPATESRIHF
ncbi:hypothetical protein EGW08_023672 [Elysia chlorotica]|uniref:Uncharacterized protein n=1 Tax=Elysia chlorotica TaxID=188477 RepID=A0A3S0ZJ00_ELYCH|nr:hypothetical protein EGW08_023672 [Elysia chlorotica]